MNTLSVNYIGSQTEREIQRHLDCGAPITSDDAQSVYRAMLNDDRKLSREISAFLDRLIPIEELSEEAYCFLLRMLEDSYAR